MAKPPKVRSLPVTIEINQQFGVNVVDDPSDGTLPEQIAAFKKRYQSKNGKPSGVIAAVVFDAVTHKFISTAKGPLNWTEGKPTL